MKLLPPTLVLILAAGMVATRALLPGPPIAPAPFNGLGLLLLCAGLALAIVGSRLFRRVGTNIRTFDTPDVLVTEGPFRWSRNPMYLGFAALLLGLAVALGTLTPLLLALVFVIAADRWYIPFEEAAMAATFGDAYRAYADRTRRWL